MTQFNQQLIEKARKGEIAILNDGSVEELRELLMAVWPEDSFGTKASGHSMVYHASKSMKGRWDTDSPHKFEKRSSRDFFMTDITTDQKSYLTEITKPEQKPLVEFAVWGEATVQVAEDSWRRQKRMLKVNLGSTIEDIFNWANAQQLDLGNGLSINQIGTLNPPK